MMQKKPRKIGILLCNTDVSNFALRNPDDHAKFRNLSQPLKPDWQFDRIAVRDQEFPAHVKDYDGYIITGSPASVNDNLPWIAPLMNLIREIDQRQIPTFAACFGHQAVAVALGGAIGKNAHGWSLGIEPTSFTGLEEWMKPAQATLKLYAANKEQVIRLPKQAINLGGNPRCVYASFRIGTHLFTTQYHPELTSDFLAGLVNEFRAFIDSTLLDNANKQFQSPADGNLFAQWIVGFLDQAVGGLDQD